MEFFVLVLNTVFLAIVAEPTWKEGPGDADGEYGDYFEGDMILTEAQRKEIEDATMSDDNNEDNAPKNGLKHVSSRWPNNTVVYYIVKDNFNETQIRMIEEALQDIASKSCVRFRERENEDEYAVIILRESDGCYSDVGYAKKYEYQKFQMLHLGTNCFLRAIIQHEMLHTLGFLHMQSTYDRDDYVTIKWENIEEDKKGNFARYNKGSVTDFGVQYDYGSVMHYGEKAFSKNGEKTIIPKKEGVEIGQRIGTSKKDDIKLNIMYNCTKEETATEKESIMDWDFLNDLPIPKP